MSGTVTYYPLTPERWDDFATLFGTKGAYGGCWCTHWRIPRRDREKYEGNRLTMQHLVRSGVIAGLLGYQDGEVVAWCSVAPRSDYAALVTSRLLKPIDEQPVWSIVCFFVKSGFRQKGIMSHSIQAAMAYAREQGAKTIEAYPIEIETQMTAPGGYMGITSVFKALGFVEVKRVSATQSIMRYMVDGTQG